jgi:hypothetical protein
MILLDSCIISTSPEKLVENFEARRDKRTYQDQLSYIHWPYKSCTAGIEPGGTVQNLFPAVHWQGRSPIDKFVSSGVFLQEANPWGIRRCLIVSKDH